MNKGLHQGSCRVADILFEIAPKTPLEKIGFEIGDTELVSMDGNPLSFAIKDRKIQSFPWGQQKGALTLLPSYPNPFRSPSAFGYEMQTRSSVFLRIYGTIGAYSCSEG